MFNKTGLVGVNRVLVNWKLCTCFEAPDQDEHAAERRRDRHFQHNAVRSGADVAEHQTQRQHER